MTSTTTRWIPNVLSISRGVTGTILVSPSLGFEARLALILWGTLSDFLDGQLARRFNLRTAIGPSLDLACDGVFFLGALVGFWRIGRLPGLWLGCILAGAIPAIAGQVVLWQRGRQMGSTGHMFSKALGGACYVHAILLACGVPATVPSALLFGFQLLANGRDLVAIVWARAAS